MLATAHAFERFAYLAPCQLCLRQREVYWAAVAMAATLASPRCIVPMKALYGSFGSEHNVSYAKFLSLSVVSMKGLFGVAES